MALRVAKPLDEDLIKRLALEHELLITLEEGSIGGFSSHVMDFLARTGVLERSAKLRPMHLPDRFVAHGAPEQQYDDAGLVAANIVATALGALDHAVPMRKVGVGG